MPGVHRLIDHWTLEDIAADFPDQPVINRGFGGSEITDSTHFAGRVIFPFSRRWFFLRAGGNDLWAGKSVEQVFADYKEVRWAVHAQLPDAKIVFYLLEPQPRALDTAR